MDEIITGELFETIGRILETETDENVIVCTSSLRVYTDYHVVFFKRGIHELSMLIAGERKMKEIHEGKILIEYISDLLMTYIVCVMIVESSYHCLTYLK